MDVRRILRVSEAVKEELYEIIGFEMEDPRLLEVEVTDVQVSPDSRHAAIKVALRGDERRRNQALAALSNAIHSVLQTVDRLSPTVCHAEALQRAGSRSGKGQLPMKLPNSNMTRWPS